MGMAASISVMYSGRALGAPLLPVPSSEIWLRSVSLPQRFTGAVSLSRCLPAASARVLPQKGRALIKDLNPVAKWSSKRRGEIDMTGSWVNAQRDWRAGVF